MKQLEELFCYGNDPCFRVHFRAVCLGYVVAAAFYAGFGGRKLPAKVQRVYKCQH